MGKRKTLEHQTNAFSSTVPICTDSLCKDNKFTKMYIKNKGKSLKTDIIGINLK